MNTDKLNMLAGFPRQMKILEIIHQIDGEIIQAAKDGKNQVEVSWSGEDDMGYDNYLVKSILNEMKIRGFNFKNEDFANGEWRFTFSW